MSSRLQRLNLYFLLAFYVGILFSAVNYLKASKWLLSYCEYFFCQIKDSGLLVLECGQWIGHDDW